MSEERYQTAVQTAATKYKAAEKNPVYRERYMDHTAGLRTRKNAIEEMQKGEAQMAKNKFPDADAHLRRALKMAPDDYTALLLMSKSQLLQKKWAVGRQYAEMAQQAYPQEAQAYHLSGFAKVRLKDYDGALEEFNRYDQVLAGDPNSFFFKGFCYEGMQQYRQAGSQYQRYLQVVNQGDYASHAYQKMREWQAKGLI